MAHKEIGGWVIKGMLFFQVKIGSDLWYVTTGDAMNKEMTSLFFFGWMKRKDVPGFKLWTVHFLSLSIHFALTLNQKQ
jgi:hypothetical protein